MARGAIIYLIGGMPRSGKSTLARYMLSTEKIPYTSTDIIRCMLQSQAPQLGISGDDAHSVKIDRFFPYLKDLVYLYDDLNSPHCLEGEVISPRGAFELKREYNIRACFLGDVNMTKTELRRRTGLNDWISNLSDSELDQEALRISKGSELLQAEAKEFGFPYFESTSIAQEALDKNFDTLKTY